MDIFLLLLFLVALLFKSFFKENTKCILCPMKTRTQSHYESFHYYYHRFSNQSLLSTYTQIAFFFGGSHSFYFSFPSLSLSLFLPLSVFYFFLVLWKSSFCNLCFCLKLNSFGFSRCLCLTTNIWKLFLWRMCGAFFHRNVVGAKKRKTIKILLKIGAKHKLFHFT